MQQLIKKIGEYRIGCAFLTGLIVGVVSVGIFLYGMRSPVERAAQGVLTICRESDHRSDCYDERIPKLMDTLSLEEVFAVTRIVQEHDPSYAYCHVLGHRLGSLETAKDPERWREVAYRCPKDTCSNGCMHGVFQERFRTSSMPERSTDELVEMLGGMCDPAPEWQLARVHQASCVHALGHLAMYVTDAHVDRSLEICERTAPRTEGQDMRRQCFDGVFMQLFQPLEHSDSVLVEDKVPSSGEELVFCNRYSGEQHDSCWMESWPRARDEIFLTPEGAQTFCKRGESIDIPRCRYNAFYIVASNLNLSVGRITAYCAQGTPELRDQCFAAAASRMVEADSARVDRALALCAEAESRGSGKSCYEELVRAVRYDFLPSDKHAQELCKALPDQYATRCSSAKSK